MTELSQISDIARILSHPTWDIVVVFAMLAAGFFYGISAGERRIAATTIYTYVAFAIASAFTLYVSPSTSSGTKTPVASGVEPLLPELVEGLPFEGFFVHSGVFLGIFLLLAFTLGSRRSRGFAPARPVRASSNGAGAWWQILLLSFFQVGLLIHIILSFLPADKIKLLAPLTRSVFANPSLHIWWLAVPIAVLIIMRRLDPAVEIPN